MAVLCFRMSSSFIRSRGVALCNILQGYSWKQFQQKLTWSQLKHLHSQSLSSTTVPLQYQHSSRLGWKCLVMMATAGFTQGFLGFSFGKDDEKKGGDPLLRVYAEAKEAHSKQDFNKAEIRYHDALKVADEMLKLKKITFKTYIYAKTNIYDSLADMALSRGELEKAERLYKETLKGCLQQGLPQEDNAIIELSIKLASIYAMLERKQEAEQGFLFCIKAQESKISEEAKKDAVPVSEAVKEAAASTAANPNKLSTAEVTDDAEIDEEEKRRDTQALLGMALETYGRFLMGQRRLAEAVPTLERAVNVAEKVLGPEKDQCLILLNDLSTAHILLKHWDKATSILNSAIVTATKTKSPQLPMLYCNLGAVFLRTSRLDDAQGACMKAQDLANKEKHSMAFTMSQNCLQKISQVRQKVAASK